MENDQILERKRTNHRTGFNIEHFLTSRFWIFGVLRFTAHVDNRASWDGFSSASVPNSRTFTWGFQWRSSSDFETKQDSGFKMSLDSLSKCQQTDYSYLSHLYFNYASDKERRMIDQMTSTTEYFKNWRLTNNLTEPNSILL